ncbi:bifunctional hydroxymethylpyrimidine kinase/phosphomethylpyrimidine kinase [Acidianus infernus]|uniref:Bifunctional hydroxymethylpyrimidine kinase/phosphomethylpyrimidine kinase n=1 Tax=Acidianus infernus TaxID=12915 RepID=A0A6A9QJU3_ACIIN|nr:bifunctional hydroxymethylpyrimidine kinase/phosphomethylpyrimidine kinase [Acidianus infernus]MUM65466.1 bifunctional hydroxymethylpyrimidine kinase/phosphomethylpyrimidine kinase [Acidianus infernus]
MIKNVALTVAGIDTGNGAGAETDIRVFEMLGVHGVMAITAITAQNTKGISDIEVMKPDFLRKQIKVIKNDFDIKSVKIGMIYNKDQFKVVNEELSGYKIITDPVIYAKDGTQLINDVDEYKKLILKISTIITPNAVEASILSGIKIDTIKDAEEAIKKLYEEYGVPFVIIKGGHMKGEYSFDILFDGKEFYEIGYPRLNKKDTHGTGSVFASVIAGKIAKGEEVINAFREARKILQDAIDYGLEIGHGIGPIDPLVYNEKKSQKYQVIEDMTKIGDFIENEEKFWKLIPEVQSNVAHSISPQYVEDLNDIATFRGRIIRRWDRKVIVGYPAVFGNPTHTARLLLAIILNYRIGNTLINIRYDEKILSAFKSLGYEIIEINRELEPQLGEGKTMQWIIEYIKTQYGIKNNLPNVIFDKGMKGKEAMIRFWTNSADEMIESLRLVCKSL